MISTPSLRRNAIANVVGRVWIAGLNLIVIPLLVGLLGPEAYGLVGFAVSVQALLAFLDFGLSAAVNREVARNEAPSATGSESGNVLRTLEVLYWPVGLIAGGTLFILSGWIAEHGINAERLSHSEVQVAVALIGISFSLRWPVSLYAGVLRGLQLQVLQNIVSAAAATLRLAGGVAVVAAVSRTPSAFFFWQTLVNLLEVGLLAFLAWGFLRRGREGRVRFDLEVIKRIWRFALSFNAVGVLGTVLVYGDKIIISNLLPLNQLGYYTVASAAAGAVLYGAFAISDAAFPRFSAAIGGEDRMSLLKTYHRAAQMASFLSVAVAMPIILFSYQLLLVWTRSPAVSSQASAAAALLAAGNLMAGLYAVPYILAIAAGQTTLPLIVNAMAAPLGLGAMVLMVGSVGITGAALVWCALQAIVLAIYVFHIHRGLLSEALNRFLKDVGRYSLLGVALFGGAKLAFLAVGGPSWLIALVVAMVVYLMLGRRMLLPEIRPRLK